MDLLITINTPGITQVPTASNANSRVIGEAFIKTIWKVKNNRKYFLLALGGPIVQFTVFKFFYPFPDFFGDSYSYIYAAQERLDISIWPIGYSKFLMLFHWFTHSDLALVSFQYLLIELSAIYFFFSVVHIFRLSRTPRNVLFIFLFFNPLFLYLANYVNSDPLFAAFSFLWFTELIWIISRPQIFHIFTQGILFFLCFTIRNNAYYYPLITIFAFGLSRQNIWFILSGCIIGPFLVLPFIFYTRSVAKQMTGTAQYSLFTGWQLANNALYAYDHMKVDSGTFQTNDLRELDHLSKNYVRSIPVGFPYRRYLNNYVGNYFIRQPESPLKVFMRKHNNITDEQSNIAAWGRSAPVFNDYGMYLIKKYPLAVFKYFLLPNTKNYFLPPLEKLEVYNLGQDDVPLIVQDWFDLKTPDIPTLSKRAQHYVLAVFPIFFCMFNVYLVINGLWLLITRSKIDKTDVLTSGLILASVFLIANFLFSVMATLNVLRYQFFPMIICLLSIFLLQSKNREHRSKIVASASKNAG